MLDKYFGFLRIHDEYTVIESLIDHTRIDEEELYLLQKMTDCMTHANTEKIDSYYKELRKISKDSKKIFDNVSDQIINANFDHQKQYDLLRIHQRIESISGMISASAKRILIFHRINATLPQPLHKPISILMKAIIEIHDTYSKILKIYTENKRAVIPEIHKVEEQENHIDHLRSDCLECLYKLANEEKIPLGNFMIIQEIIQHIEEISDNIESSARSLDWLLLT